MALTQTGLVRVQNLGEGFSYDEVQQKINVNLPQGGGLDCEAIDALPVKPWKKGTSVLAKQDGECVRLQASGDLFTDLVTSINTQTTSVTHETGKSTQATITFQVANAGMNTAKEASINIVKPLLGNYQIDSVTHRGVGSAGIVKNSETSYSVESIEAGGYVEIVMQVTFSKQGSFSFGIQAESLFDTNPANSNKTLTISVTEKDPIVDGNVGNYQPTVECPLFEIWDVETGKQLNVMTPGDTDHLRAQTANKGINFFGEAPLSGRKFRLQNAHQIVVTAKKGDSFVGRGSGTLTSSNGVSFSLTDEYEYKMLLNIDKGIAAPMSSELSFTPRGVISPNSSFSDALSPGEDFLFDNETNELTLLKSYLAYHILVKPSGNNCQWQLCVIHAPLTARVDKFDKSMRNSPLPENVSIDFSQETSISLYTTPIAPFDKVGNANIITGDADGWFSPISSYDRRGYQINTVSNESAVVTIKAGATGTFTLTADDDRLRDIQTVGGISTSYNSMNRTVTVTLNAPTTSSSIKFKNVEFKVVD